MSDTLRVLLIISSIVLLVWILRTIRKFKVKMEDAIFWVFFSTVVLLLAIFPEITFLLSRIMGFISPVNLVFIVIILLLLEKIFTISLQVSQLEDKVSVLSAELALRAHDSVKSSDNDKKEKV